MREFVGVGRDGESGFGDSEKKGSSEEADEMILLGVEVPTPARESKVSI